MKSSKLKYPRSIGISNADIYWLDVCLKGFAQCLRNTDKSYITRV